MTSFKGPNGHRSELWTSSSSSLPNRIGRFGHNVRMGKHSGDLIEENQHIPHGRRMLAMAGGITVTLVAWGFLVAEAIDFGGKARGGEGAAWFFLFLATLGATACLFLTIVLGNKLRLLLRGEHPVQQVKAPGGRRASR